jgi:small subunit ribosomal protein S1
MSNEDQERSTANPSPDVTPRKVRPSLRIKIGSQREPELTVPVAEEADDERQAPVPEPTGGAASAPAPPAQDADTDVGHAAENLPTAEEPVETAGAETAFPPPRLDRIPTDLQDEIDAALQGCSVDDLLTREVQTAGQAAELEPHSRHMATVVRVYRDSVLLELDGGHNGVAPLKQFHESPASGSRVEVVVSEFSAEDQLYETILPGKSIDVADWSDLVEGLVVEATVTGHNKGGLECEVNRIRGFIPASQVSLFRVDDLSTLLGDKLPCVVTEANPQRGNLVLSHRAVLERERQEARARLLAELEVGQTREGVVRRLHDFGAFVDLGGVDGLIHVSQLSWDRVQHPRDVLQEGQHVKVRVEKVDKASGKVGLSYRDLLDHPWQNIEGKYPTGVVVSGTVSKIMDFGAFVKLEPGVEGLVHISELSFKRVQRVAQVVTEGQDVQVKVLSVDPQAQRISLSIKAVAGEVDAGSAGDESNPEGAEPDEPRPAATPKSSRPLRGGLGRPTGGEQFGLKW